MIVSDLCLTDSEIRWACGDGQDGETADETICTTTTVDVLEPGQTALASANTSEKTVTVAVGDVTFGFRL